MHLKPVNRKVEAMHPSSVKGAMAAQTYAAVKSGYGWVGCTAAEGFPLDAPAAVKQTVKHTALD